MNLPWASTEERRTATRAAVASISPIFMVSLLGQQYMNQPRDQGTIHHCFVFDVNYVGKVTVLYISYLISSACTKIIQKRYI